MGPNHTLLTCSITHPTNFQIWSRFAAREEAGSTLLVIGSPMPSSVSLLRSTRQVYRSPERANHPCNMRQPTLPLLQKHAYPLLLCLDHPSGSNFAHRPSSLLSAQDHRPTNSTSPLEPLLSALDKLGTPVWHEQQMLSAAEMEQPPNDSRAKARRSMRECCKNRWLRRRF